MRLHTLLLVIFIAVLSVAVFAQDNKPAMDLVVYPGAETTMEINMGNEDILPMMKAMLPMLSGKLGSVLEKVDVNDLAAVLKDVKQIEMLQLEINDAKATEKDVATFYGKNLPAGEWSRAFWQSSPEKGTIALYAQKDIEAIYGYRVRTLQVDGKPVKRVEVAKIQGRIDYVKLVAMASKLGLEK